MESARQASPSRLRPHLRAAILAMCMLGVVLLVLQAISSWLVHRRLFDFIETPLTFKNQGEWLQRMAFQMEDVLPVYGSSELCVVAPNRPDEFFHNAPTGFRICPVGAPSNTSFLIAQKIAAIGDAVRGKKVAVILSGTWFTRAGVPEDNYAGNFSPLQASGILLGKELDDSLRARFVKRMLEFPGSLTSSPMLETFLRQENSSSAWSAVVRTAVRPLLRASRAELTWEDHFATGTAALHFDSVRPPACGTKAQGTNYAALISILEQHKTPAPKRVFNSEPEADAEFIKVMNASREWDDLNLMLDTLQHFKMRVMIICVPLPGRHFDRHAVSRAARDHFYQRLETVCSKRGIPCVDFADHDLDDDFTLPRSSHFSEKGWLYVNRVLDDFYHGRPAGDGKPNGAQAALNN